MKYDIIGNETCTLTGEKFHACSLGYRKFWNTHHSYCILEIQKWARVCKVMVYEHYLSPNNELTTEMCVGEGQTIAKNGPV